MAWLSRDKANVQLLLFCYMFQTTAWKLRNQTHPSEGETASAMVDESSSTVVDRTPEGGTAKNSCAVVKETAMGLQVPHVLTQQCQCILSDPMSG